MPSLGDELDCGVKRDEDDIVEATEHLSTWSDVRCFDTELLRRTSSRRCGIHRYPRFNSLGPELLSGNHQYP